ncbi:MAG: hypothetical protein CSA66_03680 [Proteobacteria bacterium]|nr:MAG: hypothetical protein CSA66_03680 [Pseudomonadota bacterium]
MIRPLTLLAGLSVALTPSMAMAAGGGFRFEVEGWYIIDFVIFVGLMWLFVRGPARKFLAARYERVKTEMEQASRLKAEAEAKLAEYDRLMAGLDAEIAEIREQFKKDGERERDRIIAEAQAASERARVLAERQLTQQTAKLKGELAAEMIAQVLADAEKQISAKMTGATQRQLFNAYIKDLDKLEDLDQFAA